MQSELAKRLSGLEERVRMIESRVDEISNRFESFRNNSIRNQRDHDEKIKVLIKAIAELKKRTDEMKEVMKRIESKMLYTASKSEIKEIEAYLQLLNPLDLVTRQELKKMIKKIGGEKDGHT